MEPVLGQGAQASSWIALVGDTSMGYRSVLGFCSSLAVGLGLSACACPAMWMQMARLRGEDTGEGRRLGKTGAAEKAVNTARMQASGASAEHTCSHDVVLLGLLSQVKAVEEEGAQVDGLEAALQYHLCHSSPNARGLLEPVTTEASSKVHVDN